MSQPIDDRFSISDSQIGSAHVAQLVEHVLGKDEVTSSILVVGSRGRRVQATQAPAAQAGA